MKFLQIFTLLLVVLVAYSSAQRCIAEPRYPSCRGGPNVGRRGQFCPVRTMWYYDGRSRQCREMRYLGCGGNSNRFCSFRGCQLRCRR